jgi:ABC-type multidrug transport system fused ATPase/permease subunit
VLEDGELTERGTHEALLGADGLCATFWRIHVGELDDSSETFRT